jgi:hydroxypyruvate isomerase
VLGALPVCLINSRSHGPALGCAAVPGAEGKFRDDFAQALAYPQAIGSERIHIPAGRKSGHQAALTFRRDLEWAAGQTDAPNLTIEPLSPKDCRAVF